MLFKRFGIVFTRLLLHKQDEIRYLEDELRAMDRTDQVRGNILYLLSRHEDAKREDETVPACWSQTRPQIMEKLEKKILEYAELLLKANQLRGLDKPSAREYRSVLNYMENDGGALFEQENAWIYDKGDLVSLRPGREHGWLDRMLERLLLLCQCRLVRVSHKTIF
ncbi:MAG: hypothetical protein Q9169_007191 [Polycauliona sp. 2 TL-2023]